MSISHYKSTGASLTETTSLASPRGSPCGRNVRSRPWQRISGYAIPVPYSQQWPHREGKNTYSNIHE